MRRSRYVKKNYTYKILKGWKDTGMFDLAPITVLFGSNSSGKSSIGQFLVMLKQTDKTIG